jgi:hypothetical protein
MSDFFFIYDTSRAIRDYFDSLRDEEPREQPDPDPEPDSGPGPNDPELDDAVDVPEDSPPPEDIPPDPAPFDDPWPDPPLPMDDRLPPPPRPRDQDAIDAAIATARAAVGRAIGALSRYISRGTGAARVERAFESAFPGLSNYREILTTLRGILTTLGTAPITSVDRSTVPGATSDARSFADPTNDNIYLFPGFFRDGAGNPTTDADRASILAHEAAHQTDDPGPPGTSFGISGDIDQATDDSEDNAYNFQEFINDLGGLSVSDDTRDNIESQDVD